MRREHSSRWEYQITVYIVFIIALSYFYKSVVTFSVQKTQVLPIWDILDNVGSSILKTQHSDHLCNSVQSIITPATKCLKIPEGVVGYLCHHALAPVLGVTFI